MKRVCPQVISGSGTGTKQRNALDLFAPERLCLGNQPTSLVSPTFGEITSTVNNYGARIFQGAVKLTF